MNQIEEAIHPEVDHAITSQDIDPRHKFKTLAKVIKTVHKNGGDTGLSNPNEPKKGSSRAVFFPSEPENVVIDGQPTKMNVALKVAIPNSIVDDVGIRRRIRFSPFDPEYLVGQAQNAMEGNHVLHRSHGVLVQDPENPNHYKYNPNGVLAPSIDLGQDDSYHVAGHVRDIKPGEFRVLTKTDGYPKGISHKEFVDSVSNLEADPEEDHPLVKAFKDYHNDIGTGPYDYIVLRDSTIKNNIGVWEHPITGARHIVMRDHGYDRRVANVYSSTRMAKRGW